MLGQWYPLARCFILLLRLTEVARRIALESRGNHVAGYHSLLHAHDVIISVYVHNWDIMAGTSTMQGKGSAGKLRDSELKIKLTGCQTEHQMYWNA